VAHPLRGVGEALTDHYGSYLEFAGTEELLRETTTQLDRGLLFQVTSVLKARTSGAPEGSWDLHVLAWTDSVAEPDDGSPGSFRYYLAVKLLKPRSRGSVRLRSADPGVLPAIEQGFLSETDDVAMLVSGVRLTRRLAGTNAFHRVTSGEIGPGAAATSDDELARYAHETVSGYFHPVGTCRMGLPNDPAAVVDGSGRVHGLDNLFVADASIMPAIPRANTNLTVVAMAERMAEEMSATA
jgi:choline dehydrogenase